MADDKINIPDPGKVGDPPKLGKVEPVKAAPPVQNQPALAKAEAPVIEDASKVVKPPTAEQPAPAGKEALKRVRRWVRTRSRPRSPAWEILPPLERWWILPLPGKERRRGQAPGKGCGPG